MIFCLYIFVVFMAASLLYTDFVQSFMGNSTSFPAFSFVLTYLDLHASFATHSILLAKVFSFLIFFSFPSIFFNRLPPFSSIGKRFVGPSKVTEDMDTDRVRPFPLLLIPTPFINLLFIFYWFANLRRFHFLLICIS